MTYDCIIVGGGPAGLSAALMLGRCRRRVLVCDTGRQRNLRSRGMHAYLTRDGILPAEFLELARSEVAQYETIEFTDLEVMDACREGGRFQVVGADGSRYWSHKLLLATGVRDQIPELDGIDELYGTSVHHCPYCDAYEWRDHPLAVYGCGDQGPGLALSLTAWSKDILLCTDGMPLPAEDAERLAAAEVLVREEPILKLEGRDGLLQRILFQRGEPVQRSALFFSCAQQQCSPLAERLGCHFNERGAVNTGKCEATNVPGLYVAGDASKEAQFVIVAAAEGAEAGMAIHKALMDEARR